MGGGGGWGGVGLDGWVCVREPNTQVPMAKEALRREGRGRGRRGMEGGRGQPRGCGVRCQEQGVHWCGQEWIQSCRLRLGLWAPVAATPGHTLPPPGHSPGSATASA
mgnify:CR=1 FL=1